MIGPLVKWSWVWHNVKKHNSTWRSLNHTKHCSFGKNCDFPVHAAKELINNNTNTLTGDDDTDQRIHTEFLSGLEIILTEEQDSGVWNHFVFFFLPSAREKCNILLTEWNLDKYWKYWLVSLYSTLSLRITVHWAFTPRITCLSDSGMVQGSFFSSCNVRLITQNF